MKYFTHLFLLPFVALASGTLFAVEPLPFTAHYLASANGLKASATRSLSKLEDGSYLLSNELSATILGQEIAHLEQTSNFQVQNDNIQTQNYSYRLSGISSDTRAINFNWDAGIAVSSEDDESWTIELDGEVLDQLSHQFALNKALLNGVATEQEFAVIDGDEIEVHRYQVLGEEVLDTPLGKLNCIKLERVREGSSSRSTVIWLAQDWSYLLARIEQVNGSGLRIQLELEGADIGGESVSPLL